MNMTPNTQPNSELEALLALDAHTGIDLDAHGIADVIGREYTIRLLAADYATIEDVGAHGRLCLSNDAYRLLDDLILRLQARIGHGSLELLRSIGDVRSLNGPITDADLLERAQHLAGLNLAQLDEDGSARLNLHTEYAWRDLERYAGIDTSRRCGY